MSRISGIRAKIERANKHIAEFDELVGSFRNSNPYKIFSEDNPNTRERKYKIKVLNSPPRNLALAVGDAVHNLRSALDHLAWQLIESNGGTPNSQSGFPIYDSYAKYKTSDAAKIKGASPLAVSLIDALKPYQGGCDDLWAIHDLDIIDKHRLLLVVGYGSGMASVVLGGRSPQDASITFGMPTQSNIVMLEDGAEIGGFIGTLSPNVHEKFNFSFEIAFGEPLIVKGKPILPFLQQISRLVDGIVNQFDAIL